MGIVVALPNQSEGHQGANSALGTKTPLGTGFEWLRLVKMYAMRAYMGLLDDHDIDLIILKAMKKCNVLVEKENNYYRLKLNGRTITDIDTARHLLAQVTHEFEKVRCSNEW